LFGTQTGSSAFFVNFTVTEIEEGKKLCALHTSESIWEIQTIKNCQALPSRLFPSSITKESF
jgi:hypothetical protein